MFRRVEIPNGWKISMSTLDCRHLVQIDQVFKNCISATHDVAWFYVSICDNFLMQDGGWHHLIKLRRYGTGFSSNVRYVTPQLSSVIRSHSFIVLSYRQNSNLTIEARSCELCVMVLLWLFQLVSNDVSKLPGVQLLGGDSHNWSLTAWVPRAAGCWSSQSLTTSSVSLLLSLFVVVGGVGGIVGVGVVVEGYCCGTCRYSSSQSALIREWHLSGPKLVLTLKTTSDVNRSDVNFRNSVTDSKRSPCVCWQASGWAGEVMIRDWRLRNRNCLGHGAA